jgi:hypothetical protein
MNDSESQSAFITALTTEHFVLQTAASATVSEAAARSSLYVFSLSSSLVAIGFASRSREVLVPFLAAVLSSVFVLGLFTIVRLVDTALENMRCLIGIARIRGYYRTLAPEAAVYFDARHGRWPEGHTEPSLRLGPLVAFFTTSASMIAFINSIVGGVGATLLAGELFIGVRNGVALVLGVATAVVLMAAFVIYQRWRFRIFAIEGPQEEPRDASHRNR